MAGSKVRKNNRDIDVSKLTKRKTKKQAANKESKPIDVNTIAEDELSYEDFLTKVNEDLTYSDTLAKHELSYFFHALFFIRCILSPLLSYTHHPEEVLSFIEPLNYTLRTFGKQVTPYIPNFAMGSWFKLLPFYSILSCFSILLQSKYIPIWILYYITKLVLGYLMFKVESTLAVNMFAIFASPTTKTFLTLSLISVGVFNAGSEGVGYTFGLIFLTYSIALFFRFLAYSVWIEAKITLFSKTCLFVLIAGIFGSPYLVLLLLPMFAYLAVEYRVMVKENVAVKAHYDTIFTKTVAKFLKTGVVTIVIVAFIDSFLYDNKYYPMVNTIFFDILMNIEKLLSRKSEESTIVYYLSSLFLSFSPVAILGFVMTFMFIIPWHQLLCVWPLMFQVVMWLSMCFVINFKSEMYLYPVYSHINVIASFSLCYIYSILKTKLGDGAKIIKIVKYAALLISAITFFTRVYANYMNNSGTITVFKSVYYLPNGKESKTLCIGDEYKTYPGSFFLPDNFRLGFVEADYEIDLPIDFPEFKDEQRITHWIDGIKIKTNKHSEHEENIVDIDECDYFVESNKSSSYLANMKEVKCSLVIDTENSPLLSKYFAFPYSAIVFEKLGLQDYFSPLYKDYCLYEQN